MNPLLQERNFSFNLPSGNYKKQILKAIKDYLSDSVVYKQQLIWTIERFNFDDRKYFEILIDVEEYRAHLKFMTHDRDGISFTLTLPELATTPAPRKRWFGLF